MGERQEGHPNLRKGGFTPETAAAAARKGAEKRRDQSGKVDSLLADVGKDPETATELERLLAQSAVDGNQSDRRLFLQQMGVLQKAQADEWDGEGFCPTCGLDPAGGLVIQAEDIIKLERAKEILRGDLFQVFVEGRDVDNVQSEGTGEA